MAAKRTGVTIHTLAGLRALATIPGQPGDQVMISDLGYAMFKCVPTAGTDDGQNTIIQNDGAASYTWVRQGLTLIGAFDVAYTALPDNTTDIVEVAAVGVLRDAVHLATVVSGMPASAKGNADYKLVRASANDKLAVEFGNNTGADLTAGTLKLNVFRVGG